MTAKPAARPAPVADATLEVHFKLFGTDGVSLQSLELSAALRRRGWHVHSCASDVPLGWEGLALVELSYQSASAVDLRARLFAPRAGEGGGPAVGAALVDEVTGRAHDIRARVEGYLDAQGIRLLHVRNLMSLPYNLPATVAIHDLAASRPDIGFLLQHHDLYWEGPNATTFRTPYAEVAALMERVLVPRMRNASHVLINPIAAEALRARTGIRGTVVPDGFDFGREVPAIDVTAFRRRLEILAGDSRPVGDHDLVVAMPARVAINKAIELAIQLVAGLDRSRAALEAAPDGVGVGRRRFTASSRVVLLLPQGEDIEDNRPYLDRLLAYARHVGVTVAYSGSIVVPDRRLPAGDTDRVPFYGTYRAADLVCYSPEHEGFGNQAIETVWARKALVVLEYPVFRRFVRPHLPHFVSMGDTTQLGKIDGFGGLHQLRPDILDGVVRGAIEVLTDHALEARWVEENFRALRSFCGIDSVTDEYVRLYSELWHALDGPWPGRS